MAKLLLLIVKLQIILAMSVIELNQQYKKPFLKGTHVLLIEPDRAIADIVIYLLESEGAKVQAVEGAEAGFVSIRRLQPDLILCNVTLPDEDGYSFLRRVRQFEFDQGRPSADSSGHIKAIGIAPCPLKIDRQKAVMAGFQGFLFEPTEYSSLMLAIIQSTKQNLFTESDSY